MVTSGKPGATRLALPHRLLALPCRLAVPHHGERQGKAHLRQLCLRYGVPQQADGEQAGTPLIGG